MLRGYEEELASVACPACFGMYVRTPNQAKAFHDFLSRLGDGDFRGRIFLFLGITQCLLIGGMVLEFSPRM